MAKPKNPFAGRHVGGTTKATRQPNTGKKKKQPAVAAGNGSGNAGGGKKREPKSFLGLLLTGAGFAALWAWNVYSRVQQRREDQDTLQAMAARPLAVTEHAACRMDCRFVKRGEIEETLRTGRINARKSQPQLKPCPKYVVDAAVGPHHKNVQGVFAACPHETRVLTVIDLDTNHPCGPC
ncbi:hypothetical protein C2E21_0968 [Chlorella sorokiniana]|uniref:DUF4258 domain-containing protein n=1 Tax=Chlorella sorokiniana TaxID=3076 RepID=A0A2P6U340_CHLSO|nr:hypothetical protein C2E21_0968 [Chlorella sorokiniana]|eukprot:PRW60724.1 hypothetical protein C2E21_0968 [Chlorella sorokiniana]